MQPIFEFIASGPFWVPWITLAIFFAILAKCADLFVDSSVAIAERANIPRIVIGIVLVSLATTAPELSVSVMSALADSPEMALGNAIGSVICNCGLALALCGAISTARVTITPGVLKSTGAFLLGVGFLCFLLVVGDHTLGRWEGGLLVVLFFGYLGSLFHQYRRGKLKGVVNLENLEDEVGLPFVTQVGFFLLGLGGIVLSSKFIIVSATTIALGFGIPESVIALTLVALGTSIPEVATSVMAARKGEGELAVGNILGANIMNICWVAGASAMVNNLTLGQKEIWFMFPAMFVIVIVTLIILRTRHELTRREGLILVSLYALYIASFFIVFRT